MKVYIFHSDWYDVCGYEDPIIEVYVDKQAALKKLEDERKLFIQSNEIQDGIVYDEPDTKRWQRKDMQCDMYVTEHKIEGTIDELSYEMAKSIWNYANDGGERPDIDEIQTLILKSFNS